MKNNNTNNNTTQAMDIAQLAQLAQLAQAMQAMQGMDIVKAVQAMQAQQAQAQAMGKGDAGKAQAVRLPNKGKAQAQGKAQAVEFVKIERQNERHTVWAVRQAMVQGKPFDSLVKAWVVLNEKTVPTDERVTKICDDMRCACLHAKGMKVKDAQDAHFEVASMVTVKRAFYCAMRGMPIVETRQDAEPAMRGKKAQGK